MLLGGDFRQILPVIPSGSKKDIIDACICRSPLWKYCKVLLLKTSMRLTSDSVCEIEKQGINDFAQWILDIGDGSVEASSFDPADESATIKIPDDLLLSPVPNPIETICNAVYTDFLENYRERTYLQQRAVVTPFNETVDFINEYMLSLIPVQC